MAEVVVDSTGQQMVYDVWGRSKAWIIAQRHCYVKIDIVRLLTFVDDGWHSSIFPVGLSLPSYFNTTNH
jgi:hypothetical protein